jgi:hypothetical protein
MAIRIATVFTGVTGHTFVFQRQGCVEGDVIALKPGVPKLGLPAE